MEILNSSQKTGHFGGSIKMTATFRDFPSSPPQMHITPHENPSGTSELEAKA